MGQRDAQYLSFLGAASYSIYLVQVASIPLFYKLSSRFLSGLNGDILVIACVIWSVAAGCALYIFFEKPVTQTLGRMVRRRNRLSSRQL